MTVWVAIAGAYTSKRVTGVYATVDAGIAAHPLPKPRVPSAWSHERPGGWRQDTDGSWDNGLTRADAVRMEPFDLQGAVMLSLATDEDGGGS